MTDNMPNAEMQRAVAAARQAMYDFLPDKLTAARDFRTAVAAYTDAVDERAYARGAKDQREQCAREAEARERNKIVDRTPQLLKVPKGTRIIVWSEQVPSFFDMDGGRL